MTSEERIEEAVQNHLNRRKTGVMETHAQTIIVFVILAILSWVGYSIIQTGKDFSVMNTSIAVMQSDMSHMKETLDRAANNYVTKVEYTVSITKLEDEVSNLKKRVNELEDNTNHKK